MELPPALPVSAGNGHAKPVKLVLIPEDALRELLVGTNQTTAEFLTSQKTRLESGQNFLKRAKAAYWSRFWLGFSALFSIFSLITGGGVEDAISAVLLCGMTFVECKVHTWFLAGDPRGATYGYWNQTLFAVLFLAYGAYHCLTITPTPQVIEDIGGDYAEYFGTLSRVTYVAIGLVGAGFQYMLACYYKRSLKAR